MLKGIDEMTYSRRIFHLHIYHLACKRSTRARNQFRFVFVYNIFTTSRDILVFSYIHWSHQWRHTLMETLRFQDGNATTTAKTNSSVQINGSKDYSSYIYYQSYDFNTILEVEDMGFMFGKSSTEPSLKLHFLRLEMQPLYQDVKIWDLAL